MEMKFIEDYIRWINWADGNIQAREMFEIAEGLEAKGDYTAAAEKYIQVIHSTEESARRACLETAWRLSKVEAGFLMEDSLYVSKHDVRNIGLDRLRNVVREIPKDSLGIPQDTVYIAYLNDFATMLWNEAEKNLKKEGERHEARRLFAEGAVLHSAFQVKCCLRMTRMTRNTQYVGLLWALKTFSLHERLNEDEIRELDTYFKSSTQLARYGILRDFFNRQFRYILQGVPPTMGLENEIKAYEFLRSAYSYLNYYLRMNYGVKQDPSFMERYAQLYRMKVDQLSVTRRRALEVEISDFYYRIHFNEGDERRIFDEWWRLLRLSRSSSRPNESGDRLDEKSITFRF